MLRSSLFWSLDGHVRVLDQISRVSVTETTRLASLESGRAGSALESLLLLEKLLVHADKLIDLGLDHVLIAAANWLGCGHLGWHDELG